MVALYARFKDKAVFPIPGLAAKTMNSPGWKPCVKTLSLGKPVGVPVTVSSEVAVFKDANSSESFLAT